jgi:hypothetical protein
LNIILLCSGKVDAINKNVWRIILILTMVIKGEMHH